MSDHPHSESQRAENTHPLWRRLLAAILGTLAVLATTTALIGHWARELVLDTDHYVAVVGPLVSDPEIQDAIAQGLATRVDGLIPEGSLTQWLPDRTGQAAGTAARSVLGSLIRDTTKQALSSDSAAAIWTTLNSTVHRQLAATLTQDDSAVLVVDDQGRLVADATPVWTSVRERLVEVGVPERALPERDVLIPVADGAVVRQAQGWTQLLIAVSGWSIVVALVAGGLALWLARDRWRAAAWLGAGVAITALLLLIGVAVGGQVLHGQLAGLWSQSVVSVAYERVTASLSLSALVLAALGALVVLAHVLRRRAGASQSED